MSGEDCLIIAFDYDTRNVEYKDDTLLVVSRKTKDGIQVVNMIENDEAEELYLKLIGRWEK